MKNHFYICSLYSAVSCIPSMCLYLECHAGFTKLHLSLGKNSKMDNIVMVVCIGLSYTRRRKKSRKKEKKEKPFLLKMLEIEFLYHHIYICRTLRGDLCYLKFYSRKPNIFNSTMVNLIYSRIFKFKMFFVSFFTLPSMHRTVLAQCMCKINA